MTVPTKFELIQRMRGSLKNNQYVPAKEFIELMELDEFVDNFPPIIEYPRLSKSSDYEVLVQAPPGEANEGRFVLSNGSVADFTFPITLSLNVTGQGGLGAEATKKPLTWYYIYAVKETETLSTRISERSPLDGGPVDYTQYKYMGACFTNKSSKLYGFYNIKDRFYYTESRKIESLGQVEIVNSPMPVEISLADFVPVTAGSASLMGQLKSSSPTSSGMVVFYTSDNSNPLHFIVASNNQWTHQMAEFPLLGTTKRLYRRFEEWSGDHENYRLTALSWIDEFLG